MEEGKTYFLGESPAAKDIRSLISRVAPYDSNVVILGESGTGKEVVARCLHEQSKRAKNPYLIVNCASIPRELESSEFFGHEKGAFTGADRKRDGLLVNANRGTLFMDELGELTQSAQAKLLRALQEREVTPVGSNKSVSFDARLIFATNEDVDEMVSAELLSRRFSSGDDSGAKRMRADFYFRLGGVRIEIPPLRDRLEDLEIFIEHVLAEFRERFAKPKARLSKEATEKLHQHKFPGNVRELRSILERAIVLAQGDVISAEEVTFSSWNHHWDTLLKVGLKQILGPKASPSLGLDPMMRRCEELIVSTAWLKNDRDLSRAAKELGITAKALTAKLKALGLREK